MCVHNVKCLVILFECCSPKHGILQKPPKNQTKIKAATTSIITPRVTDDFFLLKTSGCVKFQY